MKLPALPKISDEPKSFWNRMLSITPVVMTVIATLLAGLSSSEMNHAQYYRTLAAQVQSKAGDQWNFFQAKKLRSLSLRNMIEILEDTTHVSGYESKSLDSVPATLENNLDRMDKAADRLLQTAATHGDIPEAASLKDAAQRIIQEGAQRREQLKDIKTDLAAVTPATQENALYSVPKAWQPKDAAVKAASDAIADADPEDEIAPLIAKVNDKTLAEELRNTAEYTKGLDVAFKPAGDAIQTSGSAVERVFIIWQTLGAQADVVRNILGAPLGNPMLPADVRDAAQSVLTACDAVRAEARDLKANNARLGSGAVARRYDAEAQHNQSTALLYEIQVRMDNAFAQRHDHRSQWFFLGMLAAQAAVVTSSMALAVRQRSLLWTLAAAVGLMAASFGAYVYLFV